MMVERLETKVTAVTTLEETAATNFIPVSVANTHEPNLVPISPALNVPSANNFSRFSNFFFKKIFEWSMSTKKDAATVLSDRCACMMLRRGGICAHV